MKNMSDYDLLNKVFEIAIRTKAKTSDGNMVDFIDMKHNNVNIEQLDKELKIPQTGEAYLKFRTQLSRLVNMGYLQVDTVCVGIDRFKLTQAGFMYIQEKDSAWTRFWMPFLVSTAISLISIGISIAAIIVANK